MANEMSLARMSALALFLVAAPFAAQPALAEPPVAAVPPVPPVPPVDPIAQRVFPPELIMGHADEINLTADQRDRLIADVKAMQLRAEAVMPQMQQVRAQMVAALDAEPADEARVLAALDNVLAVERDIKRLNIATLVRIRNLLTPAQRARLDALR